MSEKTRVRKRGSRKNGRKAGRVKPLPEVEALLCEVRGRFIAQVSARMELRRITRVELALRLGVSRAFVTQLLTGEANLTLRTLAAVARALDCDLEIDLKRPKMKLPAGLAGRAPVGPRR